MRSPLTKKVFGLKAFNYTKFESNQSQQSLAELGITQPYHFSDISDKLIFQVYIFPRMTKCTFHKFGSSGEIEKHDAMCILPLNIGEKVILHSRSHTFKDSLTSKILFHQRSSSIKGCLLSKIIFNQRLSSIKDLL